MSRSAARIPTAHASRYLQQLCKHWAHKLQVRFDPVSAEIDFGEAQCTLQADDAGLDVVIVADVDQMDRYEGVVQRHLDRFAFREAPLPFDWSRAD